KYHIDSSERRKYFVSSSLIEKFVDLDRCFNVMRLPVKNDKELVLINSHMSAYDKGGLSKKKQLALLNHVMKAEIQKGNYVICGGDFNHAFGT
ncbi:endonuclease, partial [Lactobacillus gasseri]|nr:endonuclease [Lactobacillus gasseri]